MAVANEQLALFHDDTGLRVPAVTRPRATEKVRYRRLTQAHPGYCDDCVRALHRNGWFGPAPLRAAWEERDGADVTRLCHPHYQATRPGAGRPS